MSHRTPILPGCDPAPAAPRSVRSRLRDARLPLLLLVLYVAIWGALAIAPSYRQDWLLENLLVLIVVPVLVGTYRRFAFSHRTYLSVFVFLVLHAIGAHYTYSEVPYDRWLRAHFGFSPDHAFGFTRNHYDRAIHFLYGLLVTPAVIELLTANVPLRGMWRRLLPACFIVANSAVYEMLEWAAALLFGGDLGIAYVGTQGDPWDAHKDMALAALGSGLALLLPLPGTPLPRAPSGGDASSGALSSHEYARRQGIRRT